MRPRLLDLFCGAGGCSVGYHRAGFDVVGVDNRPMPRYPFEFHLGDALEFVAEHGREFDVIHASPPCQAYSSLRHLGKRAGDGAPDLLAATRDSLSASGTMWVIENVPGAPFRKWVKVCGSMFGLGVRRHRLFEASIRLASLHCHHHHQRNPIAVYGDHPQKPGDGSYRLNRARTLADGQAAMGIDWMTWPELTQAIPPAYTAFIGHQLIDQL